MVRGASVNPGVCLFSQDKLVGGRRNHLVRGGRKPRVCAFPNNAPLLPQMFIWAARFFFSSSVEGTTQKSPHVVVEGTTQKSPQVFCVLFLRFVFLDLTCSGMTHMKSPTSDLDMVRPLSGNPRRLAVYIFGLDLLGTTRISHR